MMDIMSRSDVACYVENANGDAGKDDVARNVATNGNQSRSNVACYAVNKQSNDKNGVVHNAATGKKNGEQQHDAPPARRYEAGTVIFEINRRGI